mmetsp:Transcript_4340/g.15862  ORF Transcript_4340/g.15862 Transcript_4340/m.15862 type:complete len:100 (+) Transcript_4340:549-848(+)
MSVSRSTPGALAVDVFQWNAQTQLGQTPPFALEELQVNCWATTGRQAREFELGTSHGDTAMLVLHSLQASWLESCQRLSILQQNRSAAFELALKDTILE